MKITNITHRVAAAVSTIAITMGSGVANAAGGGTDMTSFTDNLVKSSSNFPKMISTAAYICGIGMGATGVFKLKQHVDNPDKVQLKDGLVRLTAGGALLALPYMTQVMVGTATAGSTGDAVEYDSGAFEMDTGS